MAAKVQNTPDRQLASANAATGNTQCQSAPGARSPPISNEYTVTATNRMVATRFPARTVFPDDLSTNGTVRIPELVKAQVKATAGMPQL